MVGDVPNILTTGVFERKELERYARGESIFLCFFSLINLCYCLSTLWGVLKPTDIIIGSENCKGFLLNILPWELKIL